MDENGGRTERTDSRRERAKREKRRRIARAAAELFRARGYEAVTTDEIAERADVAKGTVFRYAPTKSRLLLLVYGNDLEEAVEEAVAAVDPEGDVVEELASLFVRFFRLYEGEEELARRFIRELMFIAPGERDEVYDVTGRFLERLAGLVDAWRRAGRVAADVEPRLAAQTLFALYYGVLVGWLTGQVPEAARDDLLLRSFRLHWRGLAPDAALASGSGAGEGRT